MHSQKRTYCHILFMCVYEILNTGLIEQSKLSLTPTPSRWQFITTIICQQIWPSFEPSPLKNADILNG